MALVFNPIGFGGRMEPEDAARFQKEAIAAATLAEAVPIDIKENFERARRLHLYGVLEYEFFTAAPEYALLALEAALRVRFISYYDHQIPIFHGDEAATLPAADFDAVREARKTKLRRVDGSKAELPTYLKALLAWARYERLLPARRSRIVDRALVDLRNHSAHPTGRTIEAPPGSSRMLRTVAEYINRLWGEQTPGARHFPGPLTRRPRGRTRARRLRIPPVRTWADPRGPGERARVDLRRLPRCRGGGADAAAPRPALRSQEGLSDDDVPL